MFDLVDSQDAISADLEQGQAMRADANIAQVNSIELAGEAGLCGQTEAEADPDIDILHTSTWAVRDMDAIARCHSTGRPPPAKPKAANAT